VNTRTRILNNIYLSYISRAGGWDKTFDREKNGFRRGRRRGVRQLFSQPGLQKTYDTPAMNMRVMAITCQM